MSATIAALLVGTAAVGGFGAWAGSSTSKEVPTPKEALQQVAKVVDQEEDEPSQPKPSTPPPTPIAEPVSEPVPEPVSEVVPAEETKEEKKIPEPVPEPAPEAVVQGGGSLKKQDGGFGKPTWAPLNSGDSLQSAIGLTKDQIGSTGSSLLSKWTGAKTAESIQLKLKEIDDQLRVLKVQKFNTDSDIASKSVDLEQIRTDYLKSLTNKTKYEKFSIYYDRELSKLLDPKPAGSDGSLKSIVENKFPKKKDGNFIYSKAGKPNELNFEEWLKAAHEYFKTQSDEPEGIKPKDGENKDAWWTRIGKETSSVNKEPKDIESSLETLLSKKTTNTTSLEKAIQDEQEKKPNYEQKVQELKDLRLKLQETNKKIKELLDTRELVLVELSNYELPKGMFESYIKQKPIQKPSLLPTGEERDRIIAQIKDLEKKLKNIQEQLNDEIDLQLNKDSNWKPKDDKSDKYAELVKNQSKLKDERDNKILELEGRSEKQKELLESYKKRFESSDKEISINPLQQSRQSKEKGKQLKEKIQKSLKENREEEVVATLPAVQQNQLLAEVEESRRSALPEQRQQKKEEQRANAAEVPPPAAEVAAPPVQPQQVVGDLPINEEEQEFANRIRPPEGYRKKSVFKFDDDFRYEGKNYKVTEINESDLEGDTTKMKVVDRNKKIYDVKLDGKGNIETFTETDQTVKSGGKNHLTRKQHWTRSKPSRFKTHRIY